MLAPPLGGLCHLAVWVASGEVGSGPSSVAAELCVVTDATLLRSNDVLPVLARLSFVVETATTFYWSVVCGGEDTIFAVSVFGKWEVLCFNF